MVITSAIALFIIFLFLSGIHVYWAFGGTWGSGAVLPTINDNVKVIMPGIVPTLIVAFGLLGFGLIAILNVVTFDLKFPTWFDTVLQYGIWIIAGIFMARAIGEFNYVGFFQKHRHTKFGQNDIKYYSPLCLVVSILAIIVAMNR